MSTLFSELFRIESVDKGRYDRAARLQGTCIAAADVVLTIDVNTDLFPVTAGETITLALANTLSPDGEAPARSWRPPKAGEKSLADDFDYVMQGTVYKFSETANDKLALYASFGGLLMSLEGSHRHLGALKQEQIFVLIRR